MQFGMFARKSCTWPGPTQTAAPGASPSSSRSTMERRFPVSSSKPFMQRTKVFVSQSGFGRAAISRQSERNPCAPTEMITTSAWSRASVRESESRTLSGNVRYSFFRSLLSLARRAEPGRPQSSVSQPIWSACKAWKEPQRPQPRTEIVVFIVVSLPTNRGRLRSRESAPPPTGRRGRSRAFGVVHPRFR